MLKLPIGSDDGLVLNSTKPQCATFPIDQGPDLGKNWVGLGKLSNLVARWSMVISCVLLDDSITGLQVYTVGLWWIILTLDRWSMTSVNTISRTEAIIWSSELIIYVLSCFNGSVFDSFIIHEFWGSFKLHEY